MSVKSREKALRREQETPFNILTQQKKTAAAAGKSVTGYLYTALFLLAVFALVVLLAKNNTEVMKNVLLALAVFALVLVHLLIRFVLHRRFLQNVEMVEKAGEEVREFDCVWVRVFAYPVSKHSGEIYGLLFRTDKGEKYRYIFPQPQADFWGEKRRLKNAYINRRVRCTCYVETSVIKTIGDTAPKS